MANLLQKAIGQVLGLPDRTALMNALEVMVRNEQQQLRGRIQRVGGQAVYSYANDRQFVTKYITMDDLYSVVRRIAKTTATIPMYVMRKKSEKAYKQYVAYRDSLTITKDYNTQTLNRLAFYKSMALEELPDTDPVARILANPNDIQSCTEFNEGCITFHLLTGNTYIYAPRLQDGSNAGQPWMLYILPSQFMQPIASNTVPKYAVGYQYIMKGVKLLETTDIIHMKYFNPEYDENGNELVGLSPLRAGNKLLCRIEGQQDYATSSFQNNGAYGAAWVDDAEQYETDENAMAALKSKFYSETTGARNAKKIFFTSAKIGYTAFGVSPVDMALVESERFTFAKLCNIFGISEVLFNNDSRSTENNVGWAIKDLYTNACLPERYAQRDAYMKDLLPLYNDGIDRVIEVDISDISALQEDQQKMAQVFSTLPIMNPRVIKEAFKIETQPEDDRWYIKQGYIPIEQLDNPELAQLINTSDYANGNNQPNSNDNNR